MKPTIEQIIQFAEKAGVHDGGVANWVTGNRWEEALALAYAAGAAAMKERAAKVCEGENDNSKQDFDPEILLWNTAIRLCAMKIRALGDDDETNN